MKLLYFYLILIGLFIFPKHITLAVKSNHEASLEICERYYEEGQYDKALLQVNKLINKLKKGEFGFIVGKMMFYRAKYQEALGQYNDFESSIIQGLKIYEIKGKDSDMYAYALLETAYLYLIYSDINSAESYLESAEDIIKKSNVLQNDTYTQAQINYIKAKINVARGNYTTAIELTTSLLKLRQDRIVSKENYFEIFNGSMTERKLNFSQLRRRKREYAETLTLLAEIYRLYGNYKDAEAGLATAEAWIKDNLNNKDNTYILNKQALTELKIDRGDDIKEIKSLLETNIFLAERRLGLVHKLYLRIHETMIDFYIQARYAGKSADQLWELKTNTTKFYGREKIQHAIWERLNAKKSFYQGNLNAAQKDVEELYKDVTKVPLNHVEHINVLDQLYAIAIAQDQYDKAQEYLNALKDAKKRIYGQNSIEYVYTQLNQADFYLDFTNNFETVDTLYQQFFINDLKKRVLPAQRNYIKYLFHYAKYYETLDRYQEAHEIISEGIEITKNKYDEKSIWYASSLERLIDLELREGEYKSANEHIESMLATFTTQYNGRTQQYEYSKALETSARYYAILGLYDQANDFLNKAGKLYKRTNASIANSSAVDELAYLYIRTEKFKQTENILRSAIDIRKKRYGEENRFLISPYNQLGRLQYILGEYINAEKLANESYRIARKIYGETSIKVTESLLLKSEIYTAMGNYTAAEEHINEAIKIQELLYGQNHIQLANSLTQLAIIKFYNGEKVETIEELMKKVLEIIKEELGDDNPMYAQALKNLALLYTESGKYNAALEALNQSNKIWITKLKTAKNTRSAEIEMLIGDVEMRKVVPKQAIVHYKKSKSGYAAIFNKKHPMYIKATAKLGRGYYADKKYSRAVRNTNTALNYHLNYVSEFFPALSEREKTKYWALIRNDFEFFNNLAVRSKYWNKSRLVGQMYNNVMATKALLLSSSIKAKNSILNSGDSSLINTYDEWVDKKELLTEALAMNNEQQKEEGLDPKKIEKEIEALEKELSARSSLFENSKKDKQVKWRQVKKKLNEEEVAIEIVRYRYFDNTFTDSVVYVALKVSSRTLRAPRVIPLPNGNDLEGKFLKYYKSAMRYGIDDENSYNAYWKAIDLQLPPNCKKIYLSPEGAYTQVNLETILDDSGKYIIDRHNISLIGNSKDIVIRPEKEMMKYRREIVLVGSPIFYKDIKAEKMLEQNDRPIAQLPGTYYEIKDIDKLLVTRTSYIVNTYLGQYANEDELLSMESPKVFHIATHGFFLPDEENSQANESALNQNKVFNNPLRRSGVLLNNAGDLMAENNVFAFNKEQGVLTAYEAMNLSLDYTELVVLSACETGRGDVKVGEGVYGLQRAFLVAGADAIVMSLFKVSDEATQKLMVLFYEYWIEKNMNKRDAFIEAKKQLRKKYKEPIYWGAFIMMGSV